MKILLANSEPSTHMAQSVGSRFEWAARSLSELNSGHGDTLDLKEAKALLKELGWGRVRWALPHFRASGPSAA